ncbi:hypothetical protein IU501_19845 [Nocardia otitidiscaviarum]|uniref:ESX-1 secretion-associated protein n=1 Tax=Nocardia otitidiscaviarum TaxID=1823 RepID=A0A378YUY2_9NOCA|nr:hypothetical protein [Nocardia otitidiscaviarum]MBF6135241.1 hypothetical protein [Nocardia otitidiscaviarum]MBF6237211.1 hypothetical protein [Nocardia otitidiscaviarum]MBF6487062.1 hypothetical protein [Nocardia otitidiscaviarum]SUA80618.1 Uncharacterised protein [Nocardia otitidiscaviarum]
MLVQADIDQLRTLATTLAGVKVAIDGIDVRSFAESVGAALPGTALGDTADLATENIERAWYRVAERIGRIGSAIDQATGVYNAAETVSEGEFVELMAGFDFRAADNG